jgi:hypothetical protein
MALVNSNFPLLVGPNAEAVSLHANVAVFQFEPHDNGNHKFLAINQLERYKERTSLQCCPVTECRVNSSVSLDGHCVNNPIPLPEKQGSLRLID